MRWLWDEKATGAVLSFLGSTRVGEMVNRRRLREDEEEAESEVDEEEATSGVGEDGVDPP